MTAEQLIIALLAAVSITEFFLLLSAYRRLKGYQDGGTFVPGEDCLKVTYYFLDAQYITNERETDLAHPELEIVIDHYPIGEVDTLITANESYEERKKKRFRTSAPPLVGKVLIAVDIALDPGCASKGR